ncbi:unnamed protein product, partial [marine sediment metagenome]
MKKRIAIITPEFYPVSGGVSNATRALCEALSIG